MPTKPRTAPETASTDHARPLTEVGGPKVIATRVLVLSAEGRDADDLDEILSNARDGFFIIEPLRLLRDGLRRLRQGGIDAIIADLSLADSEGIETFDQLLAAAPNTPIMILSDSRDTKGATEAMERGAQGYFCKGELHTTLVPQSLRNIIQRKRVAETFYIDKARAEITLNSISDAVIGTDLEANVDYLNAAAETLTGWKRDEARGQPISKVFSVINGTTRKPLPNPTYAVLAQDKVVKIPCDSVLLRRDGSEIAIEDSVSPIHNWAGRLVGSVIVFHDVTAAKSMAAKMAHLARHDYLTQLPNRALLNDHLAQAIAFTDRHERHLSVLFLDLDHFKHTNDSLGHAVGDKLLQAVAGRLSACVRVSDTVSRQGGDEFLVLVSDEKKAEDAALTAEKILIALSAPYLIDQHELHVTASIGISSYPDDTRNPETLIKNADMALYQAKGSGRNNFQFFEPAMNLRAVERQLILARLQLALRGQEFVLHFQPKVNLQSGRITGAEALLRWMHPDWGLTLPGRFITIAEECGLIVPIGRWVLREACLQARRWQEAGLDLGALAVNVSALEFRRNDFVGSLKAILGETGLAPAALQLEITESVLMQDAEASAQILRQLKEMGVGLAVDDFGTGYSSLSYLTQFPIDVLKIDRSFVQAIGSSPENGIVISAIIAMGTSLNQQVVAEGIEHSHQLRFLKDRGCTEGQGHFFSAAVDAENFAVLLRQGLQGRRTLPTALQGA